MDYNPRLVTIRSSESSILGGFLQDIEILLLKGSGTGEIITTSTLDVRTEFCFPCNTVVDLMFDSNL